MRSLSMLIMFLLALVSNECSLNAQETDTIVDPRDGQVYNIVRIGKQWWMAENLAATKYSDGIALVDGTDSGDISGDYTTKYYFWYDDDSATYGPTYGALYTWAAAMNGAAGSDNNPSRVQGVCPTGWHLPSDAEWKELEIFLGMSQAEADSAEYWRGIDEGGKMKEAGYTHWYNPNTGATNSSGFTALPGGFRNSNGDFLHLYYRTLHLSSYSVNIDNIWTRMLDYEQSKVMRASDGKSRGYSVRCLRNLRSDTLIVIPGNKQVTLKWDTIMGHSSGDERHLV